MNTRLAAALAGLCALCAPCAAVAPPVPSGPESGATQRADEMEQRGERPRQRDRTRALLAERMERTKQAIAMLDSGASVEEVRAQFPDVARWLPGGPREEGPPGARPSDGAQPPLPPGAGERDDRPPGEWGRGRGWGPGGGPGGRGDGPAREMTDRDRETLRELLRDSEPDMARMLEELNTRSPEEAEERYQRLFQRMRPFVEMRQRDPELARAKLDEFRTGRAAFTLAREIVQARRNGTLTPAETEAMGNSLRGAVESHLRARLVSRRLEADRMMAEVARGEAEMSQRIESSLEEMLDRAEKFQERPTQNKPDGDRGRRG